MPIFILVTISAVLVQALVFFGSVLQFLGDNRWVFAAYVFALLVVAFIESYRFEFTDSMSLPFKRCIAGYLFFSVVGVPLILHLRDQRPSPEAFLLLLCSTLTFGVGLKMVLRNLADFEAERMIDAGDSREDK